MKFRNVDANNDKRFVNLRAAADYMGVGTQTAKVTAVKIGAEKRIGKRCVYDLRKIDEYFSENDTVQLEAADEE
ncbi:MAG: hypothetical protein IKE94_16710 [Aeriscardovia sp.]|nr:hypothetical protein [Aeriscardovia sp.]MBR2756061.1 hypothetical protein [Lachnospiraceae bacterium]